MIGAINRRRPLIYRWKALPFARRFIIVGALYTLCAMTLFGLLTTTNMTTAVLQQRGNVASAIAQHVLAPAVQNLARDDKFDAASQKALDDLVNDPTFAAQFPYLDVWLGDGRIVYSNTPGLIAQRLALTAPVQGAFDGHTVVQFTDMDAAEFVRHNFTTDYIEMYIPLLETGSHKVLAVAQLREATTALEGHLMSLTLASWGTMAAMSLVLLLGLFSIVVDGSRTIDRQTRILTKRLSYSHLRAAKLRELKAEAQKISRSVSDLTDKHLRVIGTDLHDGPVQSIGFAVLKLDEIRRPGGDLKRETVVSEVEAILGGALGEIRTIAHALVLPDIENLDLAGVIDKAIQLHVRRTDLTIAVDNRAEPAHVASEIAVCVFRFIQEGLNNAFQHGLPDDQTVAASTMRGVLKLAITNRHVQGGVSGSSDHLGIGLYGLRARVHSVGGNFVFAQSNGETRLEMWLRYG